MWRIVLGAVNDRVMLIDDPNRIGIEDPELAVEFVTQLGLKTASVRQKFNASDGPSPSGVARSLRDIRRSSRTGRPKPSTTSLNGSSA